MNQDVDTQKLRAQFAAKFLPLHDLNVAEMSTEDILDVQYDSFEAAKSQFGRHFNRDAAAAEAHDWLGDRGYVVE